MRLARDGMPRDLPLSAADRRRLRERVRLCDPASSPAPMFRMALAPAGVMLALMVIWLPAVLYLRSPWKWGIVIAGLVLQLPLSLRVMRRLAWPHTCRAMAECGYEVCIRCAFPLNDCPHPKCPECGTPRSPTPPPSP